MGNAQRVARRPKLSKCTMGNAQREARRPKHSECTMGNAQRVQQIKSKNGPPYLVDLLDL
ncbi:hypothetical protein MAR_031422 [Mya arenaria]|uniref:Uncharacterized protein n=1 Tax=Mya arenaria TaxID=6604 RepID=A0ABY7F3R8_MYAAR|nr:hypothetical protein MAR_031422 [Mya arenaria]